jgi:hypothetical protein
VNTEAIQNVVGFVLAVAAESDDFRERELGPIHLLKYLFLADVAHAERNDGETVTGIDWQFYRFGPWSLDALRAIEGATSSIGANERTFSSAHRDDNRRWKIEDRDRAEDLRSSSLPIYVKGRLRSAVREFGNDTSGLLHHVYSTAPMLRAAPTDLLDFAVCAVEKESQRSMTSAPAKPRKVSASFKRKASDLRAKLSERRAAREARDKDRTRGRAPRYDALFFAGLEWFEAEAGEPAAGVSGVLEIAPEMWKSGFRRGDEVP